MKKKTLFIISISAAIIIIVFLLFILGGSNSQPQYQFYKLAKGSVTTTVTSTGSLELIDYSNIDSQIAGTVVAVYADITDVVHKGQQLAILDTTILKQTLDDAQVTLDKANLQLIDSQRSYNATKDLYDKKFKTDNDLYNATYALNIAQLNVRAAQIALDKARTNYNYAFIVAPRNGVIMQRNVEPGANVGPQIKTTPMFIIGEDETKMRIDALVDEGDISQIKVGQKANFTVQAYPDKIFTGQVDQISIMSTTVQNVVNYDVLINVDNKDKLLYPGMTATIDFVTQTVNDVFVVPSNALKFKPPQAVINKILKEYQDKQKQTQQQSQQQNTKQYTGQNGQNGQSGQNGQNGQNGKTTYQPVFLWTLDAKGNLRPIRVRLGITDGKVTVVYSQELVEGLMIITGDASQKNTKTTTNQQNTILPFGPPRR